MTIETSPSDRRQFGRRFSHVHGWIGIDGRPRIACVVRNFSETGALLVVPAAPSLLPMAFVLTIEAIDFRIGCEPRHRHEDRIGVRFICPDLVSEIGPLWSIDELMAKAAEKPVAVSRLSLNRPYRLTEERQRAALDAPA